MSKLVIAGGAPVRTKPWPKWPVCDENEETAVLAVLRSGNWWRFSYGEGLELREDETRPQSRVAQFQQAFAGHHDCRYGITAMNGTVTLEIALRALGVKPGDEVIVPAYTFIATASSVLMVNAVPIFVDIEADTYNIDPRRIEEAVTSMTRAIIPVHFGGQPCDMEAINAIARKHNLAVIEDAAHAHGSVYKDKKCGALADCGSFSFQNSKNMTAGEGGIITTNRPELAERCESLVWAGRKKGQPWYKHFELSGNYRMTEFQGAILLAQLARLDAQNQKRMENARHLDRLISQIEGIQAMRFLATTKVHSYHVYMFRYDPQGFGGLAKRRFCEALQKEGVTGCFGGYETPLYKNPMFLEKKFFNGPHPVTPQVYGKDLDYAAFAERCPVSERACDAEAVWISHPTLLAEKADMEDIAAAIRKIQENYRELL